MKRGIVIIGAGHGGVQAAASLRQDGYDGPLTLISDDRDLPYHKPPLSKAYLKSPTAELLAFKPEKFYVDQAIDLRLGARVAAIDVHASMVTLLSGGTIAYDNLILATGARARPLPTPGTDLTGVFSLRIADDARRLRDAMADANDVVVIGGGFIGLEAAATLAQAGKRVTILEAAERLMGRAVAPAISEYAKGLHERLGARVLLKTGVECVIGAAGTVTSVRAANGETIPADMVVVGVGAVPNAELADAAGLAVANGIAVDQHMRTSVENIFGLGDCVSYHHWQARRSLRLESVQNATDQARHVAKSILGKPEQYRAVPWFWSDQGDMKLQMSGLAFDVDRSIISGDPAANAFSVYHFSGERLVAVDSVNRAGDHMLARGIFAEAYNPDAALIVAGGTALKEAFMAVRAKGRS